MKDLPDRIIGHYQRHGVAWDRDRRAAGWNDRPWHERFVAALPVAACVLDLGCGGGAPVALNMAGRGLSVTGIDSSPPLVALCRARMPGQRWVVGDMRAPPIGGVFDGILAWDSFFHLRPGEQRDMFAVFAAHAGDGCLLMFNTGPAAGEAIGRYRGDPLYHASLDPAAYRGLLDAADFDVVAHAVEDRAAGGRTVWLARLRSRARCRPT